MEIVYERCAGLDVYVMTFETLIDSLVALAELLKAADIQVVEMENRLLKILEQANIELASVVNDMTGASARAMLEPLCKAAPTSKPSTSSTLLLGWVAPWLKPIKTCRLALFQER